MHACMSACMCVWVYACIHACMYVCMYARMPASMHPCMQAKLALDPLPHLHSSVIPLPPCGSLWSMTIAVEHLIAWGLGLTIQYRSTKLRPALISKANDSRQQSTTSYERSSSQASLQEQWHHQQSLSEYQHARSTSASFSTDVHSIIALVILICVERGYVIQAHKLAKTVESSHTTSTDTG